MLRFFLLLKLSLKSDCLFFEHQGKSLLRINYFLTAHVKRVKFLQASVKLAVLCVGGRSKIYHGEILVLFW